MRKTTGATHDPVWRRKKKERELEGPILASAVWWPFQLEDPQEAVEEGGARADSQHPRSFYATWTSSAAGTWTPGNSHPSAEQLVFDGHLHQMCVRLCLGDVFTCMITVVFGKSSVYSRVLSVYISCLAFHCKLGCVISGALVCETKFSIHGKLPGEEVCWTFYHLALLVSPHLLTVLCVFFCFVLVCLCVCVFPRE